MSDEPDSGVAKPLAARGLRDVIHLDAVVAQLTARDLCMLQFTKVHGATEGLAVKGRCISDILAQLDAVLRDARPLYDGLRNQKTHRWSIEDAVVYYSCCLDLYAEGAWYSEAADIVADCVGLGFDQDLVAAYNAAKRDLESAFDGEEMDLLCECMAEWQDVQDAGDDTVTYDGFVCRDTMTRAVAAVHFRTYHACEGAEVLLPYLDYIIHGRDPAGLFDDLDEGDEAWAIRAREAVAPLVAAMDAFKASFYDAHLMPAICRACPGMGHLDGKFQTVARVEDGDRLRLHMGAPLAGMVGDGCGAAQCVSSILEADGYGHDVASLREGLMHIDQLLAPAVRMTVQARALLGELHAQLGAAPAGDRVAIVGCGSKKQGALSSMSVIYDDDKEAATVRALVAACEKAVAAVS